MSISYHIAIFRQEKNPIPDTKRNPSAASSRRRGSTLFLTEGHAVGALIHSGVCLVGAHQNLFQRAVVGFIAMVRALTDGAFDALVGVAVHNKFLLFFWDRLSMTLI